MFVHRQIPDFIERQFTSDVLAEEYLPLFKSIINSSTKTAFDANDGTIFVKKFIDTKGQNCVEDRYETGVLCDYVIDMSEAPLRRFRGLLSQLGISWNALSKMRTLAAGEALKFESVFCASAQAQGKPLKLFIADYVRYCEENYPGISVPSFKPFKDEIARLLRECPPVELRRSQAKKRRRFSSEIDRHLLDGCYERVEIFNRIDSFLDKNEKGFITIEGGPGAGKSWIIARATKHFSSSEAFHINCVWHFNRHGIRDTTINFIESLFEQLSEIYDLEKSTAAFERVIERKTGCEAFLSDLLDHLDQSGQLDDVPLLIMVDALDEVDPREKKSASGVRNTLCIPRSLPKNVFFLISSRNFSGEGYDGPVLSISLSKNDASQQADIEGFIRERLTDQVVIEWIAQQKIWAGYSSAIQKECFVQLLCERSEFAFIYLFYVFQDINRFNCRSLPHGLNQYYEIEYRRLLGPGSDIEWLRRVVVRAILTFKPVVSVIAVAGYAAIDIPMLEEVCREMLRVRLVDKFVRRSDVSFLSFYHLSFYEFLEDKKNEAAKDLHSDDTSMNFLNLARVFHRYYRIVENNFYWELGNEDLEHEFLDNVFDTYRVGYSHSELARLLTNAGFHRTLFKYWETKPDVFMLDPKIFSPYFGALLSTHDRFDENGEWTHRFLGDFKNNVVPMLNSEVGNSLTSFAEAWWRTVSWTGLFEQRSVEFFSRFLSECLGRDVQALLDKI